MSWKPPSTASARCASTCARPSFAEHTVMASSDWRATNRANWDERVRVHLGPGGYDLAPLRAGRDRLNAIEEAELRSVDGLRVLHVPWHFGRAPLMLGPRAPDGLSLALSAPRGT